MAQTYNRELRTNFISMMPSNLYPPNDNFDLQDSHVIPALMRKFHEANDSGQDSIEVWGTGNPTRESLRFDDLADACVFLTETYDSSESINIGTGQDISIREVALMVKEIVDFRGELRFATEMPGGRPRRVMEMSRLGALGWTPSIALREGLAATYWWIIENGDQLRSGCRRADELVLVAFSLTCVPHIPRP